MGRAGRPQGQLKGETAQADALARFVQEVTSGVTVRELARRHPVGKTSWSEYRSAEKDIPWHLLQRLVHDRVADPRARAVLLARAGELHEQATRAARGLRPPAAGRSAARQALEEARRAQRLAEEGVAEAEELIRVLVAIVAELRGELGTGAADDTGRSAWRVADGDGARLRRSQLRDATRCLAEVRRIRESAREAQRAAQLERAALGLLAGQECGPARADDDRAASTELVVADGVQARLPALRRLYGDLVEVREALADRRRELTGMVPAGAGHGIVRGELVRTADNRRTTAFVLGSTFTGPPHGVSAGARRRTARSGAAMGAVAALLAGALVLAGVLVGQRLGTAAPSPVGPAPLAAGTPVGTATRPAGTAAETAVASAGTSPPGAVDTPGPTPVERPTTSSTVPAPDIAASRSTGTPSPPPLPAPAGTVVPTAGPGVPPPLATSSPSAGGERPAPSPAPSAPTTTPLPDPPEPGRLGGTPMTPPTGSVEIRNGNSLQCVTTSGGSRDEGRQVQQFPCADFPDHFWESQKSHTDAAGDTYYRIVSYNSALCLSVRDSSTEAAATVVQSACGNSPGQFWMIEKWPHGIRFVNGNSHQCLAVSRGSSAPEAPLMQYPCGDYPDHYWSYGPRR
ncbi:RICIN domain-containing protein [Kitasatospora sp. NPDC091207]|uniref:RICIN domain-containing protein n=1 Tax=Kitasatospora sp. NPDC091207 TaxID=3364083 RepID=UPI00380BA504